MDDERGIENDLQAMKRVFIDYPQLYKIKKIELKKAEEERQDLLHALEIGKLDAIKLTNIALQLKNVQVRRRQIKNNLEVLEAVSKFANTFNNNSNKSKQIGTVTNTVGNIVAKERKYYMRVRKDLQELVEVGE